MGHVTMRQVIVDALGGSGRLDDYAISYRVNSGQPVQVAAVALRLVSASRSRAMRLP